VRTLAPLSDSMLRACLKSGRVIEQEYATSTLPQ
jgi:hypothetical protein